jgi:hypothetical protein
LLYVGTLIELRRSVSVPIDYIDLLTCGFVIALVGFLALAL